jgi:mRNA-degrading endonuclease RelE of RelBE toxin-antitoxin system
MQILQTQSFKKSTKKLHVNQKQQLDNAIRILVDKPNSGEVKRGDLADVRVYKFHMVNQLVLLAYQYDSQNCIITLLALGSHENFYRDLKNN